MSTPAERYHHQGIPLWLLAPEPFRSAVLLYHGLHSGKDAHEKEMRSLGQAGFLAVGIDAVGHGERHRVLDWADPVVRYQTLRETALELPTVVSHLRHRFPHLHKVGAVGISLGGFTLFSALAEHDEQLEAVVTLLGSPRWKGLAPEPGLWQHSPHHVPEWFPPTALLIQNAGRDEHVATSDARDFARDLQRYYHQTPDRLAYREYPRSGHFMEPDEWEQAWSATLAWFERFL